MKNKKSLLSLGLLALVLVLGVGYAVVNTITLTFNGSASVADAELKVAITGVTSSKDTDVTKSFTDKTGTFGVSNMTLGETVTFTFVVHLAYNVKSLFTGVDAVNSVPESNVAVVYHPSK